MNKPIVNAFRMWDDALKFVGNHQQNDQVTHHKCIVIVGTHRNDAFVKRTLLLSYIRYSEDDNSIVKTDENVIGISPTIGCMRGLVPDCIIIDDLTLFHKQNPSEIINAFIHCKNRIIVVSDQENMTTLEKCFSFGRYHFIK